MNLNLQYESSLGVKLCVQVAAPVSLMAGGDGSHLSPRDAHDVIERAGKRAMPKLAHLFVSILDQIDDTIHESCRESLRQHARNNTVPLATDLAPDHQNREGMP